MKESLQIQFDQEHQAWERSLEFLKQENALLKYRLSEILDNTEDFQFLQRAEHLQNELLLRDEKIKTISGDIRDFHYDVHRNWNDPKKFQNLILTQALLRKNIFQFRKDFLNLSNEFNKEMQKIVSA